MSTAETKTADAQELADLQAVLDHAFDGTPVDPEILRSVDERADRVTEEIRQIHGNIDVAKLIRDVRDS
jgi:SepF-like predicted cell division protein (DUF552 family)